MSSDTFAIGSDALPPLASSPGVFSRSRPAERLRRTEAVSGDLRLGSGASRRPLPADGEPELDLARPSLRRDLDTLLAGDVSAVVRAEDEALAPSPYTLISLPPIRPLPVQFLTGSWRSGWHLPRLSPLHHGCGSGPGVLDDEPEIVGSVPGVEECRRPGSASESRTSRVDPWMRTWRLDRCCPDDAPPVVRHPLRSGGQGSSGGGIALRKVPPCPLRPPGPCARVGRGT